MYSGTEISREEHERINASAGLIPPSYLAARTKIQGLLKPLNDQELQAGAGKPATKIHRALKKIGLAGNYEIDSTAIAKIVRRHYGDEAGEVLRRAAGKADEL